MFEGARKILKNFEWKIPHLLFLKLWFEDYDNFKGNDQELKNFYWFKPNERCKMIQNHRNNPKGQEQVLKSNKNHAKRVQSKTPPKESNP